MYGFDMTAVRTLALGEPLVDEVYAEQVRDHAEITLEIVAGSYLGDVSQVCSTRSRVLEIDLATATPADLRFSSKFTLKAACCRRRPSRRAGASHDSARVSKLT